MRKCILVVFITCIGFASFSQTNTDAKALLQKVEKKGLSHKTIEAELSYVLEDKKEGTTEKITGTIKVKGNMFSLSIDETQTYCDGATKWVYLAESNEVNVTEVYDIEDMEPEERFMNSPLSIYGLYKDDFKYSVFGNVDIDGKQHTMVDLTPNTLDKPYFKIRYWISGSNDIYAVKYFQKDGMRISLFFEKFQINKNFNDKEFKFDETKFPNIEVIDLR